MRGLLLILGLATTIAAAPQATLQAALEAGAKGNNRQSLELLAQTERELGRPTPRVESLRVFALVGMQDWVQAKIALNRYKRLAPNATSPAHQALLKLEPQIDAGVAQLEAKWKTEAAKRVEAELKQLREAEENFRKSAEAALRSRAPAVERLQNRVQTVAEPEFVAPIPVDPNGPAAMASPDFTLEKARQMIGDGRELQAWLDQGYRDEKVEELLRAALAQGATFGDPGKDLLIKRGRPSFYGLSRHRLAPDVSHEPSSPDKKYYAAAMQGKAGTGSPMPGRLINFYSAGGYDFLHFSPLSGQYGNPKAGGSLPAKGVLWIGGQPGRVPLVELNVLHKRGYELVHLSLHHGQWHASLRVPPAELGLAFKLNQPAPASQYLLTGPRFPEAEYQRLTGEGYQLRDLQFTDNQWIVILSKLPEGNIDYDERIGPRILTAGSFDELFQKLVTARQGVQGARDSLIKIQSNHDRNEWVVVYHESQNKLLIDLFLQVDDTTDELLRFLTQPGGYRVVFAADTGLPAEDDSSGPGTAVP